MKRRSFLKKAAATAASSVVVPYILPSGRLFAQSGTRMADHVVFVMFAGGVRQQEAMLQQYIAQAQELSVSFEGNIMYNMMPGAPPTQKIVYGTTPQGGLDGSQPIAQILNRTIGEMGTTFRESRTSNGGHYGGLNTLVTGAYNPAQGLKVRPLSPTIFEYARRYLGETASKVWFIGNTIRNSTPLLNYSVHEEYGWKYGANFLAPNVTFGRDGQEHIKDAKVYHPEEDLGPIYEMQAFLNNTFDLRPGAIEGIHNTIEEKHFIKEFIREMFIKKDNGTVANPPVTDNGDLSTMGWACEVLKWFKPTLTVINMSGVDSCHGSFTQYLGALHRADHAVGHLWNFIESQIPEMAGNTALIVCPECGRNMEPNPIIDVNDWKSFDHSGEANTQRIWTMMAGPGIDPSLVIGSESNPLGDAADCVPTIADILGIKSEVMNSGQLAPQAMSLFDRI